MQLTSAENSRAAIRATENVRSSSEIGRPFQLKGAGGPERGESTAPAKGGRKKPHPHTLTYREKKNNNNVSPHTRILVKQKKNPRPKP
jgi:hypothetical protein